MCFARFWDGIWGILLMIMDKPRARVDGSRREVPGTMLLFYTRDDGVLICNVY